MRELPIQCSDSEPMQRSPCNPKTSSGLPQTREQHPTLSPISYRAPAASEKMYLMYYEDEAGNRVYTLKVGVQPLSSPSLRLA